MATSTIPRRLSVLRQPVPPAAYAKLCRRCDGVAWG